VLDDLVNEAPIVRLLRVHEHVPLHALLNLVDGLARVFGVDLVEAVAHLEDLLGVDGDVGGLAGRAAGRLVDHDPRVGQHPPLTSRAGGEQERGHGCGLADAERGDRGADVLHGVVDGEASGDDAPGGVDVEVDGLGGVLGLEEEQLRDDERGRVVVDGPVDADDALLEQAREDVVGALPAGGVLDDHGHQPVLAARGVSRRRQRVRGGGGEEGPRSGGGEAAQHGGGGALGFTRRFGLGLAAAKRCGWGDEVVFGVRRVGPAWRRMLAAREGAIGGVGELVGEKRRRNRSYPMVFIRGRALWLDFGPN
jgi:hypothetical protein